MLSNGSIGKVYICFLGMKKYEQKSSPMKVGGLGVKSLSIHFLMQRSYKAKLGDNV